MITEHDLVRMHESEQAWAKSQRFTVQWISVEHARDPRRDFADQVEALALDVLNGRGNFCVRTRHKEHFDLLVEGVRIEVKASNWDGEKYSCQLRDNRADALAWACLFCGAVHWFIIPFGEVLGLKALKISQHDPRDYHGKWMRCYDAWNIIDEMVDAGVNSWQMSLMWRTQA
jgi:hypothetical protein